MTYETNYLAHYGVKGMKWGVRKEIARKARTGGRVGIVADAYAKKRSRYDDKISIAKSSGASSGTLTSLKLKRDKYLIEEKRLKSIQNKLYRGLSKEDIDRGRKAAKRSPLIAQVLGGPIAGAAYAVGASIETNRTIKKYAS